VFELHDSGSEQGPITYQAYKNENPIFSGGFPIICPKKWTALPAKFSARQGFSSVGQVQPGISNGPIKYMGVAKDYQDCVNMCSKNNLIKSFTWFNVNVSQLAFMCYGRTDTNFHQQPTPGAVSGQSVQTFKCHMNQIPDWVIERGFMTLFVNHKRYWRARYPNEDLENYTVWGGIGYINATEGLGGSHNPNPLYPAQPSFGMQFDPNTFSLRADSWTRVSESVMHIFPYLYWGNLQFTIDNVFTKNNTVLFCGGGGQMNLYRFNSGTNIGSKSKFFIENVFEELDAPGEFYFNKDTKELFVCPFMKDDLDSAALVVPVVHNLLHFKGHPRPWNTNDPKVWVQHVHFKGLTFTETAPTYLEVYDVPSNGDWTIHRAGTLFFETARHISIRESLFDQVGGNAVFINSANLNITIDQNDFVSVGDSAVCLVGDRMRSTGSSLMFPRECHVTNNHMNRLGYYGKQVAGVFVSNSDRVVIRNNKIHDIPRAGILINDGFCGGHFVEHNYIYDCVKETKDHGPFNSWGRERFWSELFNHPEYVPNGGIPTKSPAGPITHDVIHTITVRNNLFVYSSYEEEGTASDAIDMDDGSSNLNVYDNVCVGSAVKVSSSGDLHNITNNVFIDPGYVFIWDSMISNHDYLKKNIIYYTQPVGEMLMYGIASALLPREIDYNLFYSPNTTSYTSGWNEDTLTLKQWQQQGYDQHSLFGLDPLFYDVARYNFTLKPNSPAFKLGIHNFKYGNNGHVGRSSSSAGSTFEPLFFTHKPRHMSHWNKVRAQNNKIVLAD
jgi:hypothetical protein